MTGNDKETRLSFESQRDTYFNLMKWWNLHGSQQRIITFYTYLTLTSLWLTDPSSLLSAVETEGFSFSDPMSSCIIDATRRGTDASSCNSIKAKSAENSSCSVLFGSGLCSEASLLNNT